MKVPRRLLISPRGNGGPIEVVRHSNSGPARKEGSTPSFTEKGVESFLPLWSEMHQWSDRQRLVHQPLFSGYLFVHIGDTPQRTNDGA